MTGRVLCALALLAVASSALAYDMGDLPKWKLGDMILACTPPPDTTVPETNQWPAAAWFEHNDTQFVIYAKHLAACDPETKKGKFTIWVSVPPQYKQEVQQDHEFSAADAYAYLQRVGAGNMVPELYKGPGDTWTTAPGAENWTPGKDRCVIGVFEPKMNGIAPDAFALHRLKLGNQIVRLGQMKCRCPKYDDGEAKPPEEEWIAWVSRNKTKQMKVDQWGLPGNTPVPVQETETPAEEETPPATEPETPVQPQASGSISAEDIAKFSATWIDRESGVVTAIYPDGTWTMVACAMPGCTPRSGVWGVADGSLTLRTFLATQSQLWVSDMPASAATQLVSGRYDLSMVWGLNRAADDLLGALRTWTATADAQGNVDTFMPWDSPATKLVAATWDLATTAYPGTGQMPPDLMRLFQRLPRTPALMQVIDFTTSQY